MSWPHVWSWWGPPWLDITGSILAVFLLVVLRRVALAAIRGLVRALLGTVAAWTEWTTRGAASTTWRLLATFTAWGARRLAPFRTGHGVGAFVNALTRPVRLVLYHLATPVRHRSVDRIVCGDTAVRAAMCDPIVRVPYRGRLDALGVDTALGEDDPVRSDAMREDLRNLLIGPDDLSRVLDSVRSTATAAVAAARVGGKLDAVTDLIQPACTTALAAYLGLDEGTADEVFWWSQLALNRIFLSPSRATATHDWLVESSAMTAKLRFESYLLGELRSTRQAASSAARSCRTSTVLEGLAATREADVDAAMAFAISIGPHLAWTTALVLDELLRHPLQTRAAFGTQPYLTTEEAVRRRESIVNEALRFNAPSPGVMRFCSSDHLLLSDDRPVRRLGAGHVLVFTRSSDFDSTRFSNPLRFLPWRFQNGGGPPMAFSNGRHECLGKYLAPRLMVCMLEPLLCDSDVRPAKGASGRLSYRLPPWSPLRAGGTWSLPTSMVLRVGSTLPTG